MQKDKYKESHLQFKSVIDIKISNKYKASIYRYDAALLKLKSALEITRYVRVIPIHCPCPHKDATVIVVDNNIKRALYELVKMKLVSISECAPFYRQRSYEFNTNLCAMETDGYNAFGKPDVGSALVEDKKQIEVTAGG